MGRPRAGAKLDGQFIGHFCSNWPILEGVGQKKKFMARNIYLANFWPISNHCS
jgi:hypothetical protein